jgi:hypothetical protein
MEYDNNHFIIASRAYSLHLAPIAEVEDDEAGERLESQKGTIKSAIIN